MNTIAIENLVHPIYLRPSLNYSSNSFVEPIDKIEEQIITDKFLILKNNIGEDLYDELSFEQKMFIVNVSGTIDLGKTVDIDAIYKNIKEIEYER